LKGSAAALTTAYANTALASATSKQRPSLRMVVG
jgi:hypothetical protein